MILYIGTYQLACHKSKMFRSPVNNLVRNGSHLKKSVFFFLYVFFLLGASKKNLVGTWQVLSHAQLAP